MTARQLFEYALIELNKVQAPSLILEDYNYFINKAVNQYINKVYNLYDINQQKSDDLRVLKSTAVLTPSVSNDYGASALFSKSYEVDLPDDYLHILNCVVEYTVASNFKCYNAGDKAHFGAKRLTADMFSQIINNYYMRPSYKNPYFYINNVNLSNVFPTSSSNEVSSEVIDFTYVIAFTTGSFSALTKIKLVDLDNVSAEVSCNGKTIAQIQTELTAFNINSNVVGSTITITDQSIKELSVEGPGIDLSRTPNSTRTAETRYGNKTKVRMEIRYGKDNTLFTLSQVYIDYLKAPQFIRLTQNQVDEVEDNSQILEFPDYVCQEVTNELIKLLMENGSDPRLQTNIPINQSIANPQQEQQQKR